MQNIWFHKNKIVSLQSKIKENKFSNNFLKI